MGSVIVPVPVVVISINAVVENVIDFIVKFELDAFRFDADDVIVDVVIVDVVEVGVVIDVAFNTCLGLDPVIVDAEGDDIVVVVVVVVVVVFVAISGAVVEYDKSVAVFDRK